MNSYIRQLNAIVNADRQRQADQAKADRAAAADDARQRLTPLDGRLALLLAAIPITVQREGLSLPTLRTMLRGRWRGQCHPGELGAALRRLDWTRRRCWRGGENGFSSSWYPPGADV